MIQPSSFWIGAACVYMGFTLAAFDLLFEPQIGRMAKFVGWSIIAVLILSFSRFLVFVPAPLGLGAAATAAEFPGGTVIGGIPWKPFYTELDILINNPTDDSYDDVDLLLQPDHPVAAVGQASGLPGVSFQDRYGEELRVALDESAVSLVLVATNAGYRVHCGRIPPQSALRVVMAVVELRSGMFNPPTASAEMPNPMADTYVARARIYEGKDELIYWWAHPGNERRFYDKRPIPKAVKAAGHYTASNRRRSINERIIVP